MNRVVLFIIALMLVSKAYALTIIEAKDKCLDLGFKVNTEQLGNCVLKLSNSSSGITPTPTSIQTESTPTAQINSRPVQSFKDCDECPEMIPIPAGSFLMGSPPDPQQDPFSNAKPVKVGDDTERPQHRVIIQSFAIGKYEVTQEQWYSLMGNNPSSNKGRTLPVENVSWDDAQTFVQKLRHKTGKNYRLPSEAEWEYAARAGSLTSYPMGNTDSELHEYAWINAKKSNPVGLKKPNAYGLYDMLGNVWEWTQDCWNSGYAAVPTDGSAWLSGNCYERVLRGGGFFHSSEALRYAKRKFHKKDDKFYAYHGFRVAMDL